MGDPVGLPVFLGKSHVTVSTGNSKQSILAVSLLGKAENKKGKGKKKSRALIVKGLHNVKVSPTFWWSGSITSACEHK